MALHLNNGDGQTSGSGAVDPRAVPPGPAYADPGARSSTDSDWVRRDMLYKTSLPQQKFS
jgi:hypothetical protein